LNTKCYGIDEHLERRKRRAVGGLEGGRGTKYTLRASNCNVEGAHRV
jgi:hypothetical protein